MVTAASGGWTNDGDDFAFVSTVDAKIRFVDGKDGVFWKQFTHANQAKVGEIGMTISIALCKIHKAFKMAREVKGEAQQPVIE